MVALLMARPSRFRKMTLLLILLGAALVLISPVSAEKGVTILAYGDQSYFLGETVILHGNNSVSDSTYLYLTGPNIHAGGGQLTSPQKEPVNGDPSTFTVVKTNPDQTWEYRYYTANLPMDAGTYTIYAASRPTTKGMAANDASGMVSIIIKRPFITGEVSPATIARGQSLKITGIAEGKPADVRIWIFGKNTARTTIEPVRADTSFTYEIPPEVTTSLEAGQYFVIVQHPMQNARYDIDINTTTGPDLWACSWQVKDGNEESCTRLFKFTGAGSLQGIDAAEALSVALSEPGVEDSYTMTRFTVEDTGTPASLPQTLSTAAQVQPTTKASPLQYAPVGAIVLMGIVALWNRRS